MLRREFATVTIAVVLGSTSAAMAATVQVTQKEPFGSYLTDATGKSLYLFEADENAKASTCYDECAQAWPPLIAEGEKMDGGAKLDDSKLGTVKRKDGSMQVTYGGWPLYYYAEDEKPGDTMGQDVKEYGAEWYLISPEGEKVEAENAKS